MIFPVNLSPSAIADAEEAYLWLKAQNPELADAWFSGIPFPFSLLLDYTQ